ncbi:TetR/AcrR family transcriptional regulator [Nocardiopsis sp. HUAS JQ3]|uniref:TetR/AcrR family transcriptional regulator n=1 Tax=Nocardiopsis sp. HUAS JQ3 TaxID=3061629 RepID=UPI0023A9F020|nr:TetR/AcrR family transcriptional regulator [Nocardiopsis sp. HUAS JQ3]WDZ93549.1 TetR/AcrR family transcriptional regulator [Nocardiopsis sp. HUAS JQ3]
MANTDERPQGPIPRTPREEVRQRLLAAAAKVFAERGYANSRLEDIAREAGFTKGAIYSNFGSKQELFGSILREGADVERTAVMNEFHTRGDTATMPRRAARIVARRITEDSERGQLGLEFAALAAHDARTKEVVTPLRRSQREAAARSIAEIAQADDITLAVAPELAGLILHCLSNGLSMEHIVDPEAVDQDTVEQAVSAVITGLLALAPTDR